MIECINHYVTESPINGHIEIQIRLNKIILFLIRNEKIVYQTPDCSNLQGAYENLLEWIIEKSDIQNR